MTIVLASERVKVALYPNPLFKRSLQLIDNSQPFVRKLQLLVLGAEVPSVEGVQGQVPPCRLYNEYSNQNYLSDGY